MKKLCLALFLCLIPSLAFANAFETLTCDNTAAGVGLTVVSSTTRGDNTCVCGPLESGQIRFRTDGTAPTSSVGHLLEIGQTVCIGKNCGTSSPAPDLYNFKCIRTGTTSGSIPCTCW